MLSDSCSAGVNGGGEVENGLHGQIVVLVNDIKNPSYLQNINYLIIPNVC